MQLIAECTYAAMYAMRDPKGKTVKDLFPFLFEEDDDGSRYEITEAEIAELQADPCGAYIPAGRIRNNN